MLPLAELQSAMRDVSLGGDATRLAGTIVSDGFSHAERLNIHRNNTTILLTDALAATFAVVVKLVGEDFFDVVTRLYVRAHPPQTPCLFEYGEDFPDFLASLPAAAGLPYLADVARLAWCWNEAFHAADDEVLTSVDLAGVSPDDYGDLRFSPHPSLRLVSSAYPIKEIWDFNQCSTDPDASVDLDEGGQAVLILRPKSTVTMIELSMGGFALTNHLIAGHRLEDAFAIAQRAEPGFDPATTLAVLISAGAFRAYALKTSP